MKRSIMNLRIDIVLVQIIIKAQAVSYLNDIKVISMIDIGSIERSLDTIYSGKRFIIASYDFMTTFKTCFRTLQLRNTPRQPENQSDGNYTLTPASRNTSHHDARAIKQGLS